MKNAEIRIIIETFFESCSDELKPNFKYEIHMRGNGAYVSTRVGHISTLTGKMEYSHPGIGCCVWGIQGKQKIEEKLKEHLKRYDFLTK